MSYGGFDRPKASIFSLRSAEPDPARDSKRFQQAAEDRARKLAAEDHPTILALPDYLARTGRSHLWRDFGDYNKQAIDRSLLDDLQAAEQAQNTQQIQRLRHLILAAATEGFPRPEEPLSEVRTLVLQRIADAQRMADAKRAASDDTENEDHSATQWRQLLLLLESKYDALADQKRREESIDFLEETLRTHYFFLDRSGHRDTKNRIMATLQELKRIRNAAYWRLLTPDMIFPASKKAA